MIKPYKSQVQRITFTLKTDNNEEVWSKMRDKDYNLDSPLNQSQRKKEELDIKVRLETKEGDNKRLEKRKRQKGWKIFIKIRKAYDSINRTKALELIQERYNSLEEKIIVDRIYKLHQKQEEVIIGDNTAKAERRVSQGSM